MKILMIAENFPYPPFNGMRAVIYNSIKEIAREHQLYLISFYQRAEDLKGIDHLREYCEVVKLLPMERVSLLSVMRNIFERYPLSIKRYQNKGLGDLIDKVVRERKIDLIHYWGVNMAQFAARGANIPKIICPNDCITARLRQRVFTGKTVNIIKKIYELLQSQKMSRYEAELYSLFDCCYLLSDEDRQEMRQINPNIKTAVVPMGVDHDSFKSSGAVENNNDILFVGAMSSQANQIAARFFAKDIFPLVTEKCPQARFNIVGGNPPAGLKRLAERDNRIRLLGYVKDVKQCYENAAVVVCPLRTGTGIKTKLMEAMSMGRAIVTTSIGRRGLPVVDQKHLLVADRPGEFAVAVIKLLRNPDLRRSLGKNARGLIERSFTWEEVGRMIEQLYEVKEKTQ